jgi:ethanolamine utilization protein EutA (predicted chaperonin)
LDEKIFKETGKASPSMLNDWEIKAHAAAQKNSDSRMESYGKIDIGGGRYVDKSVVEAAATRNVQPLLDEINEKAEKERIHQAEVKLEEEAQKRAAENEKNREKELKEINRRLKGIFSRDASVDLTY